MIASDLELIAACKLGNRASQEALYKRFAAKMLGVCLRYSKDRSEAEDILQEGFIKVFLNMEKYRGEGSLEGWVRRIMVNTALEKFRSNRKLYPVIDVELAVLSPTEGENIFAKFAAMDILKMIQGLPAGYRTVFNLYAIEGYSHEEISGLMGISEGTSKSQLSRARLALKELIKQSEMNQSYLD